MPSHSNDLTRTILRTLFIVALMGISLWILLPFLAAIIWAVTIVAATWPLMITIQSWLWGRRGLAVTVMTLILLAVLVVPLSAAIGVIAAHTDTIIGWAKSLAHYEITTAPDWLRRLPFVGFPAAEAWDKIAASGLRGILDKAWPYTGALVKWFLSQMGDLGALFVQFLLTVLIAALLYTNGERAAQAVLGFGKRLAGPHGEQSVRLAGQAIRGVALGVVVTALAQSLLGGLGLVVCGVPFAPVLTAVMLVLAIAQIGPIPVLLASVIWLYWSGATGWGTGTADLDRSGGHHGQFPPTLPDQERGRPAAAAHLRRRDRRPDRLRDHRHLYRSGGAGRGLHPDSGLGGRGGTGKRNT